MARRNPLIINLKDIPPEGSKLEFTRETGELDKPLKELIGSNPYTVQLSIEPQGNTFLLKGTLKTSLNTLCSRCAIDLKLPVSLGINEFVVIEKALEKGDHQARVNHAHEWSESAPDYLILANDQLDLGAYLYELIALEEPVRPLKSPDCEVACENLTPEMLLNPYTNTEPVKISPFQVLEKLKLKS